jgi:hypothetical protein
VVDQLTPTSVTGEELRIRAIAAGGIVPPVDIGVETIFEDGANGFIVVTVPASPQAPHAVIKNEDLRYPIRDGSAKRWMREPEVADRYRRRFATATSRLERLESIDASIRQLLDPDSTETWLVVSAVPDADGRLPVGFAPLEGTKKWIQTMFGRLPANGAFQRLAANTTVGFRRYIVSDMSGDTARYARQAVAELHTDGASASATVVGWDWSRTPSDSASNTIGDTGLATALIDQFGLVGEHAQRAGCSGSINLHVSIQSSQPVDLGHTRQLGMAQRLRGTRTISDFDRATHTFDVDDLTDPQRLVAAAALAGNDLLATFGLPESLQLTTDGKIRKRYVESDSRLHWWADTHNVETTDEQV